MTTTLTPPVSVEEKLDEISAQLAAITAEVAVMKVRRESRDELLATVAGFGPEAVARLTAELQQLQDSGGLEDITRLVTRLGANAAALDRLVESAAGVSRLLDEAAPLAGPAFAALSGRLEALDDKGYFAFGRHSAAILERVVTAFGEDDIDQLGENVVLILETVKEMTQPEVMRMLRRTATAVQSQQQAIASGGEKTPSLWRLMRRMRDPEVRKGLSRAIDMLQLVAADPGDVTQDTKGDG